MKKVIFLDRDNTIIVDKNYLNDPDQIEYVPEIFEAFKKLKSKGYDFIVVTNQSGIAKGIVQIENLEEIHKRIAERFEENGTPILDFYFAPYPSDSNHPMRKPNPGMLLAAKQDHNIDMSQSWMIGDKLIDIEAGQRAGCKSLLYNALSKEKFKSETTTPQSVSFLEISNMID